MSSNENYIKIAYFATLAGASILFGFSLTLNKLRKNSPITTTAESKLYQEGVALASKALMRGTIYSVCGFGIFTVASYHLFGKQMIANFNSKAKNNDEKDIAYLQNLFKASRKDLLGNDNNYQSDSNRSENENSQS